MGRSEYDVAFFDTFTRAVLICDIFAAKIHTQLCNIL